MGDQPKISMESVKFHTFDAVPRPAGTVYDVDPQYVETLIALQFARRMTKAAAKPEPPPPAKPEPPKK